MLGQKVTAFPEPSWWNPLPDLNELFNGSSSSDAMAESGELPESSSSDAMAKSGGIPESSSSDDMAKSGGIPETPSSSSGPLGANRTDFGQSDDTGPSETSSSSNIVEQKKQSSRRPRPSLLKVKDKLKSINIKQIRGDNVTNDERNEFHETLGALNDGIKNKYEVRQLPGLTWKFLVRKNQKSNPTLFGAMLRVERMKRAQALLEVAGAKNGEKKGIIRDGKVVAINGIDVKNPVPPADIADSNQTAQKPVATIRWEVSPSKFSRKCDSNSTYHK
jgi:hypothetical protein